MDNRQISKKQLIIFLAVAFGLGWILEIVASIFANTGNSVLFTVILTITMFIPLLGVIIARIPFKGMGWVPHLKGKIRYIFFALWMPALLSIIGGVLFFVIIPQAYDPEFTIISEQLRQAGALKLLEAMGITIPIYILINTIPAVTYAPFINMFVALGEEVGWRGVLYPYLKEKLGVNKGRILGGAIWGCWHWPIMIFAGYEYGKEYLGAPVLGPILFCFSSIVMGILLDYVYEKTKNIWIPSLMHGAINAFTIFAYITKPEYSDKMILGPCCIGIISMLPMIILALIICIKAKTRKA